MANYVFGVDVGGTTVKLGLFDIDGNLQDKWEIPTRTENGGVNILPDVAASVQARMEEKGITKDDVAGVGIGAPGPVDGRGIIHKAVNLGWSEMNLKKELSELLGGMQVEGGNDANVAALGEMWKGGGQGHKDLVAVTLGTGVGGGIIINGKVVTGCNGSGGEIGHIHVEDNETEVCGCGNLGCLEEYASATGITRLANRKLKACDKDSVLRQGEVSAKTVFDAVKAGDELAIEVAKYSLIISVRLLSARCSTAVRIRSSCLPHWATMRASTERRSWCWDKRQKKQNIHNFEIKQRFYSKRQSNLPLTMKVFDFHSVDGHAARQTVS